MEILWSGLVTCCFLKWLCASYFARQLLRFCKRYKRNINVSSFLCVFRFVDRKAHYISAKQINNQHRTSRKLENWQRSEEEYVHIAHTKRKIITAEDEKIYWSTSQQSFSPMGDCIEGIVFLTAYCSLFGFYKGHPPLNSS